MSGEGGDEDLEASEVAQFRVLTRIDGFAGGGEDCCGSVELFLDHFLA